MKNPSHSDGFTLGELMIVIPVGAIIIGTLYTFMVTVYLNSLRQYERMESVSTVNASLDIMRDDIALSMGPATTLGADVTDSYGPPGGGTWTSNSNSPFSTLIVREPTTTSAGDLVRINQNGCTAAVMSSNAIYSYRAIYFVQDNKLYRRVAMDQTPPTLCQTPVQATTCPDYGTPPAGCARDRLLASDVSKFLVRYQVGTVGDAPNNQTCPAESTNNPDHNEDILYLCDSSTPATASVVTVILEQTRRIDGQDFTYQHRFTTGNFSGDKDE